MPWRPRVSQTSLRRSERLWTLTTLAHPLPFIAAAAVLAVLQPLTLPLGLILLMHAWAIPELYAARGARVVAPRGPDGRGRARGPERERMRASERGWSPRSHDSPGDGESVAVGLLGDLVGDPARELHARTALIMERGQFGVWLLGQAGALLVRPGGRRVDCYCVHVPDPELPPSDRIAHLLLALREDEPGFTTVANLVFSGAPWRVRRRLRGPARDALVEALSAARGGGG